MMRCFRGRTSSYKSRCQVRSLEAGFDWGGRNPDLHKGARKDDAIANSPDDEPLTSRLKIVGDPGPGVEPVTRLAHTFKAISATKPALAATKLAELPSFNKSPPPADMKDADVGEPG
ncbi:hypothetical protein P43SY_011479 [Pythium insidiosum]|uniref:Uncharacterized protein n=1 Tax=Pythium insidiosum TaxID=114742 RepID=A0AAD5L8T3_PYTIN|nr:hypothetical protein P43SY_011479 [Pythium insidiosum]